MIAAGIGCRANCSAADILAALRAALSGAGRNLEEVRALCAPEPKRGEHALRELALRLGKPLLLVPLASLEPEAAGALSDSPHVRARFGLPSLAETAALAGARSLAGAGAAVRLLGPRHNAGGASCALAIADAP